MIVWARRVRSLLLKSSAVLASTLRVAWFRFRNENAVIPWSTRIGAGVRIRVTDGGRLRLSDATAIDRNVTLYVQGGMVTVGAHAFIGTGTLIVAHEGITIGDDALIAEYVTIRDQNHARGGHAMRAAGFDVAPIHIGNNVWLGAKASVLKGAEIGDGAVIGANAVVTHSVPADCVAVGVPAKVVKLAPNVQTPEGAAV